MISQFAASIRRFFQVVFRRSFDVSTSIGRWETGLLMLGLLACVRAAAMGAGDFEVYFHAAQALWSGDSVYLSPFFLRHGNSLAFSYPLFWAFLWIPFSGFPLWLIDFLWLFLNLVLCSRVVDLINYFFDFQHFTRKNKNLFYFFLLLFTLRFLLYNFDMSQVTIALVWLFLQALCWLDQKRWAAAGGLIALGINIKIMPIVLLPYLLWRGYFRAFGWAILGSFCLFFLPLIGSNWVIFWQYQQDFWQTINPTNAEFTSQQNAEAEGLHSLSAAFFAFFYDDENRLWGFRRNIFSFDSKLVNFYLQIARLFLIGLTVWFLRFPILQAARTRLWAFWEVAYLAAVVPLIFPHQQKYAFFMLLPAWGYLLYFAMNFEKKYVFLKIFLFLIFCLTTLSTDGVVGKNLYKLAQYYKLITFGTLLTIPILMWATPKFLSNLKFYKNES